MVEGQSSVEKSTLSCKPEFELHNPHLKRKNGELTALAGDSGSIPRTHIVAHSNLQLQFHGIQLPLLTSTGKKHVVYRLTCSPNTYTHKIKNE